MSGEKNRRLGKFRGALRRLLRDRRGGPAMEFALIAPILATCLVFVYDLGNALQQHIRLREAVRAGGLYAVHYNQSFDGMVAAVSAAVPDWTSVNVSLKVPTVSWNCYCWTSVGNVSTPVACTNACGNTSMELQRFVSFQATKRFDALFLTTISLISVNHVVRVQ